MLFDSLYVMMGISLCNFSLKATLHVITKCDDLKQKKNKKRKRNKSATKKKKKVTIKFREIFITC